MLHILWVYRVGEVLAPGFPLLRCVAVLLQSLCIGNMIIIMVPLGIQSRAYLGPVGDVTLHCTMPCVARIFPFFLWASCRKLAGKWLGGYAGTDLNQFPRADVPGELC